MKSRETLFVLDGNNYAWRAWYSIPPLSNSVGFYTNAVRGFFHQMVSHMKLVQPTHLCVTFDSSSTWRRKILPEYKENRKSKEEGTTSDVIKQIKAIKSILKALGILVFSKNDQEADDLIYSLVKSIDMDVIIGSNDKDLVPLLVDKRVTILTSSKSGEFFMAAKEAEDKFGVKPEAFLEYIMMVGDTSDNVKGVRLIGAKKAVALLTEYGSIGNIYKNIGKLSPSMAANFLEAKARLPALRQVLSLSKVPLPRTSVLQRDCSLLALKDRRMMPVFDIIMDELDMKVTRKELLSIFG